MIILMSRIMRGRDDCARVIAVAIWQIDIKDGQVNLVMVVRDVAGSFDAVLL